MDALSFSAFQADPTRAMDRVCDTHQAVIITREQQPAVVMLSLEEYQAMEETAHLLRSPANARRLLAAIADLKVGGGLDRQLLLP